MKNISAVILAGGESSRFWPLNFQSKVLFKIMGKPLIYYTISALKRAGIKNIIIVQEKNREIEAVIKNYPMTGAAIHYVTQKEPRGMGDALWQAKSLLSGPFFVLNASRIDAEEIISEMKKKYPTRRGAGLLVGQETETPELYGIIKMRGSKVAEIVEKPKAGKEPSKIRAVGIYLLEPGFFDVYKKTKRGAYDFEAALSAYTKDHNLAALLLQKGTKSPSLKYPWHISEIKKYLFDKYLKYFIAKSVKVAPNAIISGKVFIGEKVKIFENAVIKGPVYIGKGTVVGNNTLLRDYVDVGERCIIGANAEIARSSFGDDVHCHSGFFGDSVFSSDCRIGAGVITANVRFDRGIVRAYSKKGKINTELASLGAIVGKKSHIGVGASLMPGALIGSYCIIGPNAMVQDLVEDKTIFYSQFKNFKKQRRQK